jgi:hypothetical protein
MWFAIVIFAAQALVVPHLSQAACRKALSAQLGLLHDQGFTIDFSDCTYQPIPRSMRAPDGTLR